MANTERFGFSIVGGGAGGSLADDQQKHTSADRVMLDELLSQVEGHTHHRRSELVSTEVAPTLTAIYEGGDLEAGETYYYRTALFTANGVEMLAGDEVAITLPEPLESPDAPSVYINELAPVAGALPPAFYRYALTALAGSQESPLGESTGMRVIAGSSALTIEVPAHPTATDFRVWRTKEGDASPTPIGEVSVEDGVFVDDGSIPPDPCAANYPPPLDSDLATYGVEVTIPADAPVSAHGWLIYRTSTSGDYPSSSLVQVVTGLVDEFDPESGVVRSWVDDGTTFGVGSPIDVDRRMSFEPHTIEVLAELPPVDNVPEGYPVIVEGVLYALLAGAWAAVGGGGGGNPEPAPAMSPVLTGPDGRRWTLSVDATGALVTTETLFPGPPAAVQNVVVS